ncbi:MAG: hypothetical protein ACYDCK_05710 [Thermoplasmatota archaeon]
MRRIEDTAFSFHRACVKARVEYAFVGGIAVLVWGQPRMTADVDALVALDANSLEAWVAALRFEGLGADERDLGEAMVDGAHVTIFDNETQFHVDVKPALSADERAEVRDARKVRYEDGVFRVACAEDVVAWKVKFGSPQDLQDARQIVIRQNTALDRAKLRATGIRIGVAPQLEQLLREADRV